MTRRKSTEAPAGPIAPPRRFVPTGTYLGGELQRTSTRPGAYDAFSLPSKMGSQHVAQDTLPAAAADRRFFAVLPEGQVTPRRISREELKSLITPAAASARAPRPLTPTPRGPSLSPYVPHPGSTPARVIAALQAEGGMLTYADISDRFGVPPGSVTAVLKAALLKGALVRHVSDGQRVRLHLPGYVLPTEPPAAAPAPAITASIADALATSSAQLEALANAYAKALNDLSAEAATAGKALLAKAKEIDLHMRAASTAARTHVPSARRAS